MIIFFTSQRSRLQRSFPTTAVSHHAMPPRLVRSKRGRVAHRPGCRKFRSRITDAVVDCADARSALCTQCAPMCVVCFSEPGRPTGCVEDHGICYDCLELHLGQHAQNDPAAPLRCPCGSGELDFLKDVPPESFARWRDAIGTRRCTVPQPSIAARMCEEARTLACPHCGRQFVDFDGCAALRCTCGRYFCAMCLAPCGGDSDSVHAHVVQCPHNPVGHYYVSPEHCRAVWLAMARENLCASLRTVSAIDGTALAWALRRAVYARDPELAPPRPARHSLWEWALAALAGGLIGVAYYVVSTAVLRAT